MCPRKQSLWQYLDEEVQDVLLASFHSNTSSNNPFVASFQEHWKEMWAKELQHHHHLLTWIGGVVLVVGLVMWVLRMVMLNSNQNMALLHTRPVPAGKRLLSKKGRPTFQGTRSKDRIKRD
jgi:hypothetical protein